MPVVRLRYPPARFPAIVAVVTFASLGCTGGDPRAAHPVEFQVLVGGKPAAGATVVLNRVGSESPTSDKPTGKVGDDGVVRFSTYAHHDGAPAGDYAVSVTWFDLTSTPEQAVVIRGGDKLKGRFSNPDDPKAPRVTVQKGPNLLPPLQL